MKILEELRKDSQKQCQVMMRTLETDNVQSEFFQIHGELKDKREVFTQLAKKYTRYKVQIVAMSQKRHEVLEEVDVFMGEFAKEKAIGGEDPERVAFLKQMDDTCNQFNGCYSTLQRGEYFYRQLATHVEQCEQTVNDFVISRRMEKEEILAHAISRGAPQNPRPLHYN